MPKTSTELETLRALLEMEKQEDLEQFKRKVEQLPLEQRKKEGLSWYPVEVTRKGFTIGERAYVQVERNDSIEEPHQFRGGKTVRLFSQQPSLQRAEVNGVVHFVDKKKMKIILNIKDIPDWIGLGMIGVDLLFDDRTYIEMDKALRKVIETERGRLADLRDIILGKKVPTFSEVHHPSKNPLLNPSQNQAIDSILAARDIAVVHGPPGTGKTTTLVEVVRLITETEPNVLVCAPSNTAVDLLTERLAQQGLRVCRIGNISRVGERIIDHTLEVQVANHPESKNIKKVKQQATEARKKAIRYRRKFGRDEYLERKRLFQEAGELSSWANQLEDRLIEQLLDSAQVITCTLVGASDKQIAHRKFRTVFIDEAAQALEPANWIPMLRATRVVLAGDPFQLPPTVKSRKAQKRGFNVTLMEKCIKRVDAITLLRIQYRMNHLIMQFSNQQFYDGVLEAAPAVADRKLELMQMHQAVVFIDTAGAGFEEKMHPAYRSRYNPEEFQILSEHLIQLTEIYASAEERPSIALISPYREQVRHIESVLEEELQLSDWEIDVNTIDGFQGQEKDVVYISLVRSNQKAEIGFLSDYRRMNVAMTRARKLLVIVGDSATIGQDPFYQSFLEFCEQEGSYQSAFEYMR